MAYSLSHRFALHHSHGRFNGARSFNHFNPLTQGAFLGLCLPERGYLMFDCTTLDGEVDLGFPHDRADLPAHVAESLALLRQAFCAQSGRVAVVSSFGADSAVLLALVADIDPSTPVLFVDTGQHFAETLAYRDELTRFLGLTDVRSVSLTGRERADNDPTDELWKYDPDACCRLRKVTPLDRALAPFDAWVTGRKRHQAMTRVALPLTERVDGKTKFNPLAAWSAADIEAEMLRRSLPRHALSLAGYPSIGCATCTRAVAEGEDPRSGRWSGTGKTECGIHRLPALADA
jgi:phosphoadenosine phosphosulfate reductase